MNICILEQILGVQVESCNENREARQTVGGWMKIRSK